MAKDKMHVVFASAEVAPFVKTGGLGDVAGSLPQELVKDGSEVIVMCPKYASIPEEFKARMEHFCDFYVPLGWRNEYCGLEKLEELAPVFLREFYQGLPLYERVKTIFTIHNIAFQGQFSDKMLNDVLGLAHIPNAARQLRCDSCSINFMQGALCYSDAITTVSPSYAREIKTSDYGEGLDWVLRNRSESLQGILNGIDEPSWDPATDYQITENFSVGNMAGKAACKRALQEELGLEVRDDRPLMVMVTRLTRQKGMDLVTYSLDRILSGGVQVAVLGTGDRAYEDAMNYFAGKYPGTMAARITFDSALSRRMYAGADLFLMPSLFEPCGLSQIIAMRYGTLPVVRETGGLRDTVIPYNYETGEGTGFSFANFNGDEMGDAVFRGARLFWDDRDAFNRVVEQAMKTDFSWKRSAGAYMDLYTFLHPNVQPVPPTPPAPEPKPVAEPEPEAKPEPKPEPAPAPEPKAEAKPEPAKKPEVKPEPKPAEEKAAKASSPKVTEKPAAKKPAARKTAAKPAAEKAAPKAATAKKTTAAKAAPKTTATKAASTPKTAEAKTTAKAAEMPATSKAAAKPAAKTAEAKPVNKPAEKAPAVTKATAAKTTATKAAAPKTATKTAEAKPAAAKPAAKAAVAKPAAAKPAAKSTATAKPAAKTTTAAKPAAAPKAEEAAKKAPAKPAAKPATKTTSVSAAKKRTTKR